LLCFWKNSTNFLYHKIKEKETLNFEQNLEESCDIKIDFCDIENLENISLNSANDVKFTLEKTHVPDSFVSPPQNQKKKGKICPPQIKARITLCVFTTNKGLLD
jgi:hypothetical protein